MKLILNITVFLMSFLPYHQTYFMQFPVISLHVIAYSYCQSTLFLLLLHSVVYTTFLPHSVVIHLDEQQFCPLLGLWLFYLLLPTFCAVSYSHTKTCGDISWTCAFILQIRIFYFFNGSISNVNYYLKDLLLKCSFLSIK